VEEEEEYNNSLVKDNVSLPSKDNSIDFNAQYMRWQFPFAIPSQDIAVISSRNELEQYYEEAWKFLSLAEPVGYNWLITNFLNTVEKYNDDYFANNYLVIVGLVEMSGSITHKVESVSENGDIVISWFSPEIQTDDIERWNIIIELSNDVKVEEFKVVGAVPAKPSSIDFNVHYARRGNSSVEPSLVTVISSKDELNQYFGYDKSVFLLWAEQKGNAMPYSGDERYSDDFFANNYLAVIKRVEPSGSIMHRVESIDKYGEIVISRLLPKYGTMDIATWSIVIELSNDVKIEKYKATLVDVNL
jgi:hypothetical protein